jgi:hypothetical protein
MGSETAPEIHHKEDDIQPYIPPVLQAHIDKDVEVSHSIDRILSCVNSLLKYCRQQNTPVHQRRS